MTTESSKSKRCKLELQTWLGKVLKNLPPGYETNRIVVREVEVTLVSNTKGVRGMRVRRLGVTAPKKK